MKTKPKWERKFDFTFYPNINSQQIMYRWRDSGKWDDSNSSKNVMVATIDDIKDFIRQTIDQEVKEAVKGFVKKIEKMKIDDLPNAICIKSEDYPEGDIVEGITYNTIIDNLLGKKEK